MNARIMSLILVGLLTVTACDNDSSSTNRSTGDPSQNESLGEACSGQIQLTLGGFESNLLLPLGLDTESNHPWRKGGYSIRSIGTDNNFSIQIANTLADHQDCNRVYKFLDPELVYHETEDMYFRYGHYYFLITPQRYHEANPAVFDDIAALNYIDKLDEEVNTALDQTFDAGVLDHTLFFAGIDPDDTNENVLGGTTVPTQENTNIIGAFSMVQLNCDENFQIKPTTTPSRNYSGYEFNAEYCRESGCLVLETLAPAEGSTCRFDATLNVNRDDPQSLMPPEISDDVIHVAVGGRLERLQNAYPEQGIAKHRWRLFLDQISILP